METQNRFYKRMWLGQGILSGFKIYGANIKSFIFISAVSYLVFIGMGYYLFYIFKNAGGAINPYKVFDVYCETALYFYFLMSPFVVRVAISYSLGHPPNTMLTALMVGDAVRIWLVSLVFTALAIFSVSSYVYGEFTLPILGAYGFVGHVLLSLTVMVVLMQSTLVLVVAAHEKRYGYKAFKRALDLVSERKISIMVMSVVFYMVFNSLTYLIYVIIEKYSFAKWPDLTDHQKVLMANRLYHTTELAMGALYAPLVFIYLVLFYFQIAKEREEAFD